MRHDATAGHLDYGSFAVYRRESPDSEVVYTGQATALRNINRRRDPAWRLVYSLSGCLSEYMCARYNMRINLASCIAGLLIT